jgi:hypothetical protein
MNAKLPHTKSEDMYIIYADLWQIYCSFNRVKPADQICDSVAFLMLSDANNAIAAVVKTTAYTSVWIVQLLGHR